MVVRKFDDEDLCTVFQSFKCPLRDVPIDGSKCIERSVVPGHESCACSGAVSHLSELFCISPRDGFADVFEAGLRCWNEWHNFGRFGMVVETVGCKSVGADIHLCLRWQQVHFSVVILVAPNMQTLEGDTE
jgi:hypothetical protein